jgi:hypothetical protein
MFRQESVWLGMFILVYKLGNDIKRFYKFQH